MGLKIKLIKFNIIMVLEQEIEKELLKIDYGISGFVIPSLKVNLIEIAKNHTKTKLGEAGERDKIEKLILDWLKSGNENTTHIAELIKISITETPLN